jgi:hypothetical protein
MPRYANGAAATARQKPYTDRRLIPYAITAVAVARLIQRSAPPASVVPVVE